MRPSWPHLAVLVASLLVASVCARLGFWQLDRLEQRRAYNGAVAEAMARPDLNLDLFSDSLLRDAESFLYRPAVASGRPVPSEAVLLRGRTDTGRPGVHLVVPVRLNDGAFLLVNRGWIPAPDGATADPREWLAEGDAVRGLLQRIPASEVEPQPLEVEVADTTIQTYRRLDYSLLADRLPGTLLPLYLEVIPEPESAGDLPAPVAVSTLDEGPHFGYAVQWFSFALIALLGPLVFVAVRRRQRTREDAS